eukprot:8180100-Ditylum_brightwellii.AAC.1
MVWHMCKEEACVEGGDTLEGAGGKAEEQGDSERKDISESGETTQHKEKDGEDEEGNPEIRNGVGNNEDS